ncbi:MAG TPA: Ig-like domain-containing protein [Patescibacteria group bacterium]|nr:Ig-like domain-containing protein [Patescibacteria group bacterium]
MTIISDLKQVKLSRGLLLQLIILGVIAILIVWMIIILLHPSQNLSGELPSPTPILNPAQVTTSPEDKAQQASIYGPFVFTFPQAITKSSQTHTTITSSPQVVFTRSWDKSGKVLTLTPLTILKENQNYSITVILPEINKTLQFTTTSSQQLRATQAAAEGLTLQQLEQQYPWYSQLPLFTGKYYVTFDLQSRVFHARLNSLNDPQTEVLKQTVTKKLQSLGVDLQRYTIIWE